MPGISEELEQITRARYGEEVRKAIHDSIEKCYGHFEEVTKACAASEKNAKESENAAESARTDALRYSQDASRDAQTASTSATNAQGYANTAYQSQQSVQSMKAAVEKDKNEIETTIKDSLLAKSEEILATVKDYFNRAQQLYQSMYIDCDGETPQSRLVTLVTINCGTPQSRLHDVNGILFDGGTPLNRKIGG